MCMFHAFCVFANWLAHVYAAALHSDRQCVTADDLPVQAGSHILYILQFLGTAMLQQPEYVNELSSGCRQSLRVSPSSSFTTLVLRCVLPICAAFCEYLGHFPSTAVKSRRKTKFSLMPSFMPMARLTVVTLPDGKSSQAVAVA